jgi:hypothetical protein
MNPQFPAQIYKFLVSKFTSDLVFLFLTVSFLSLSVFLNLVHLSTSHLQYILKQTPKEITQYLIEFCMDYLFCFGKGRVKLGEAAYFSCQHNMGDGLKKVRLISWEAS